MVNATAWLSEEHINSVTDDPKMREMAQAAQWLKQAQRSVADIGAAVGYQSEAAFTKAFKRHAGMGPGQYRRGKF